MSNLPPLGEDVFYIVEVSPLVTPFFRTARVANAARFFAGERALRPDHKITQLTEAEWRAQLAELTKEK